MAAIQNVLSWSRQHPQALAMPWLMIGKGPSFAELCAEDFTDRFTIGLNHVAQGLTLPRLDMLHIFDVDVVESYGEDLMDKVQWLVLPSRPNEPHKLPLVKGTFHRKSNRQLSDLADELPVLRAFAASGRLLSYERSDDGAREGAVQVGSFSGSTVIAMLNTIGVSDVVLAGIDGGVSYAPTFNHLRETTLLSAGQGDFEAQFREMAAIRSGGNISIRPLRPERNATVYIGAESAQSLATRVLAFSIDRRSSYTPMIKDLGECLEHDESVLGTGLRDLPGGTPFSLQRFAIPHLQGHAGRAVYLDSDMLVFEDIRHLAQVALPTDAVGAAQVDPDWNRPEQLSVLVMDCASCTWNLQDVAARLRDGAIDYATLMREGPGPTPVARPVPAHWNSLESFVPGHTHLLHFTDMSTQPWLYAHNRNGWVWCEELLAAIEAGAISPDEIARHVRRGWVRPSLQWQVDNAVADPARLPVAIARADRAFVAPHMYGKARGLASFAGLGNANPSWRELAVRRQYALLRAIAVNSPLGNGVRAMRQLQRKVQRVLATNSR